MQSIIFTGSLARDSIANTTIFFTIEEAKETLLDFSKGTLEIY